MMKLFIYTLLLSSLAFGANEYKQPNDAIFYKTLKIPLLTPAGITTNTSGGQLGTVSKVPIANGGTNSSNDLNNNRVIVSSGGTIGELNSSGTSGQILTSGGSSAVPAWISVLPVANGGTNSSTQNWVDLTTLQNSIAGAKTFTTSLATPSLLDNGAGLTIQTSSNQNLSLQSQNAGRMIFNNGEGLDIAEVVTPTRAAVNYDTLYFKSDHNLYTLANTALSTEYRFGLRANGNWNNNRVLVSSGDTISEIASNGTSGNILQSNGNAFPTWVTNAPAAANITGILAIAHGGTNSSVALNNNRVLVSSGGTMAELSLSGTSGQVLTSNGNALPTWQSSVAGTAPNSNIYSETSNGHGATSTCIRRFTTVGALTRNVGSDITYADDANLGASFTINSTGLYFFSYNDNYSAGAISRHGWSVNASGADLTTAIQSITAANRIMFTESGDADNHQTEASGIYRFNAGDVLRPHDDCNQNGVNAQAVVIRIF